MRVAAVARGTYHGSWPFLAGARTRQVLGDPQKPSPETCSAQPGGEGRGQAGAARGVLSIPAARSAGYLVSHPGVDRLGRGGASGSGGGLARPNTLGWASESAAVITYQGRTWKRRRNRAAWMNGRRVLAQTRIPRAACCCGM